MRKGGENITLMPKVFYWKAVLRIRQVNHYTADMGMKYQNWDSLLSAHIFLMRKKHRHSDQLPIH